MAAGGWLAVDESPGAGEEHHPPPPPSVWVYLKDESHVAAGCWLAVDESPGAGEEHHPPPFCVGIPEG